MCASLLLALAAGCGGTASLQQAENELRAGSYALSRASFERALDAGEDSAACLNGIAASLLLARDDGALDAARRSDSSARGRGPSSLIRAAAAQERACWAEAAEAAERARGLPALSAHARRIDSTTAALRRLAVAPASSPARRGTPQHVIAVLPIAAPSGDTLLALAAGGLSDFLMTDLSKVAALTVVERLRLREVLGERERDPALFDPSTLPPKGRLLSASILVDGMLARRKNDLALTARAVATASGKIQAASEARAAEADLFQLEKRIVLALLQKLDVRVTAAERRSIQVPLTEDPAAFFEYCRGLRAWDRGEYPAAARHFGSAAALDARFELAAQRREDALRKAAPPQPLRDLVLLLYPAPAPDTRVAEGLLRTGALLLQSGFLNNGTARRDGPDVLPYPPGPP